MTWMAALNCFALAFGPTMAVYHAAQLGEYSAGLACSRAAFLNILTQFFKVLFTISSIAMTITLSKQLLVYTRELCCTMSVHNT
eukprot:m.65208 g.65208  ORF g.65208 m.65208 type:complete len:84 (-) comp12049_c0_seq3:4084-4335(-)